MWFLVATSEPLPRHVFRDAMEFLIGRPLSETELDVLQHQFSVRSDANTDLVLRAMERKRIRFITSKTLRWHGKEYVGETFFHAVLAVKRAVASR